MDGLLEGRTHARLESHRTLISAALFVFFGLASAVNAQIPTNVNLKPMFGTDGSNKLINPVWFGEIPGKTGSYLVAEQGGISSNVDSARIWVLTPDTNGGYKKQKFLSLKVRQDATERGFMGFAFHPNYSQNGKYYVSYTGPTGDKDSAIVDERTASVSLLQDGGSAPRRVLGFAFDSDHHHSGGIAFGRDKYLYIGYGDGGEGGNGLKTLQGAMLRIDVDNPSNGLGYGIPSNNPFVNDTTTGVRKEIWAYGFRNPWRWSFDATTGYLWVGDVGQEAAEEIDRVPKGANLGWPTMEGGGCFTYADTAVTDCNKTGLTSPIMNLPHPDAECVIGGYMYRANRTSVFYGAYIFGDWGTGNISAMKRTLGVWQVTQIATTTAEISSFGTDSKGNIYVLGHNTGIVYLLDHSALVPTTAIEPIAYNAGERSNGPRLIPVLNGNAFPSNTEATLYSLDGTKVGHTPKNVDQNAPRLGAGIYIAH